MTVNPNASAWPPQSCADVALWLNARLDGECDATQESWLALHVGGCRECAAEWAELERTRLAFATARLREPSDFEREALQRSLGPQILQSAGWVLLTLGVGVLLTYGAYALAVNQEVPLPLRLGLAVLGAGTLLLLWRYGWERWRVRRRDPYRDVLR